MDKIDYDVIILGSGLKELLVASLLSLKSKKVLLIRTKKGYDAAEIIDEERVAKILKKYENNKILDKIQLKQTKNDGEEVIIYAEEKDKTENIFPEFLKKSNDLYKNFEDVRKVVEGTDLLRLLEIKHTMTSPDMFRVQMKHRISADADELLASGLMGILEKRRYIAFRDYCQEYRQDDPETHKDWDALDPKNTGHELYRDFGFDPYGKEFNLAVARLSNEDHFQKRAYELIRRVQLCHNNLAGVAIAPFFLPLYRKDLNPSSTKTLLGDLIRFAEMKDKGKTGVVVKEHENIHVMKAAKATENPSVKIGDDILKCKLIICHPEFCTELCESAGEVARQVFLCKKFNLIQEYLCCHWRVPFRQMRKHKENLTSDICITFLNPQLLLNRSCDDEDECPAYIGMIETMDDWLPGRPTTAESRPTQGIWPTPEPQPSTSKGEPAQGAEEGLGETFNLRPPHYQLIELKSVEEKLEAGLKWMHVMDDYIGPDEKFDIVKTKLWKPKMDLYQMYKLNGKQSGDYFTKTKVLVTNNSEMTTPFEMICGEASDIMKAIDKSKLLLS